MINLMSSAHGWGHYAPPVAHEMNVQYVAMTDLMGEHNGWSLKLPDYFTKQVSSKLAALGEPPYLWWLGPEPKGHMCFSVPACQPIAAQFEPIVSLALLERI